MAQPAVPGKMQEYISNIEFSLNFEDSKKSTKVKIGDLVMYDGVTARHFNKLNGQEFVGRAVPLKSAVANNWLTLNIKGAKLDGPINVKSEKVRDSIVYKDPDYNPKTGGAFDKFVESDPDTVVATHRKVIQEEDQVVKKTDFNGQKPKVEEKKTGKLEVSGDQVDVKTVGSSVSNSTSSAGNLKRAKMPVVRQDDGHADRVITSTHKVASNAPEKPKNSFTVDNTTPKIPSDSAGGATMDEIRRITAPVKFDDAQDGQVVRKVSAPRMADEPAEQEGIVLKKTAATKKQASGSTPVADLSEVKTQSEVDALEKSMEKKEASSETKSYIEMLPEDWSALHWVKKEKFIMQITDIEFLKFIMKVESIKAVQNACKKRITEIEKQAANG